ncbi:hemolymph lipopolysaccharide-binding protein-like isoform X6 [Halictus rubicundus]|uniref:hemolymph lipopolysaccharide-binding protein-like isoform X6 n=1 Tax=Halictus rubicundus TaxID=77578 RepID=UPI004035719F
MRKLSLTSLAGVVLVVLFFEGGQTFQLPLETPKICDPNDQTNKSAGCPIPANETFHVHNVVLVDELPHTMFKWPHGCCVNNFNRKDYVVTPGIGAHKLFQNEVTWNTAREICMQEGGQLAVINSAEKAAVFRSWASNETAHGVWIGIHDLFEQGKWVTVTGEPVAAMSYYPWAAGEPNNEFGVEHCAALWKKHSDGIFDVPCSAKYSFICEINLCEDLESVRRRLTRETDSISQK